MTSLPVDVAWLPVFKHYCAKLPCHYRDINQVESSGLDLILHIAFFAMTVQLCLT